MCFDKFFASTLQWFVKQHYTKHSSEKFFRLKWVAMGNIRTGSAGKPIHLIIYRKLDKNHDWREIIIMFFIKNFFSY